MVKGAEPDKVPSASLEGYVLPDVIDNIVGGFDLTGNSLYAPSVHSRSLRS